MNVYEIKNLCFSHDGKRQIFSNANLVVEEGKLYSLLGKNGAGKSTLFTLLLNLNNNYDGEILFEGKNLKKIEKKELARRIGFVPQTPKLSFDYTAKEYVAMGLLSETKLFSDLSKDQYKLVEEAFAKLSIEDLIDKSFYDLSGGEKQLVVIARSIVSNPKVILFDEPTSHLDIANQYKVLKIIKSLHLLGYTVIVSTHDPNQVTLLKEHVIIVKGNGGIESGETDDVMNEETLKKIYDIDIEVENIEKYDRKICFFKKI